MSNAKKNSIHQQMLLRRASRSEFKDGLLRHNQRQENRLLLELEQWEKAQRMVARGLDKESTRFKQSAASTGYGPPPRLPKRSSLSELTENGQPRFIPDYQYRNRATIAAQPGFTDFETVPRTDQQSVVPSENNSNDASQQQQQQYQQQQKQQNQKQQQQQKHQQQQQQQQEEKKKKEKDSEHESSKPHRHTTHGKSSEGEGKKSERRSSSDKHGDHHHHHHRSSSHSHKKSKHHREEHDSQGKETGEREKEKKKKAAESGKTRSEEGVPGDEKKVAPLTIAAVEGSSSALVNNKHNYGHQPAPTSKPTSHPKPSTKPGKKTSLDTATPLLLTPHPNSSSTTTTTTTTTLTDTDIMDGVLAQFGMDDSRPDTLSKSGARSFSISEDVHDPGDVVVSHRTVRDFGWDGRRRYNNVWDNLSAPKHTSQVRSVRSRLQREFTQIPPPSREGSSRALAVRSGSARATQLVLEQSSLYI